MSKKVIRQSVWETNSSSTHSLTLGELSPEQEDNSFKFDTISIKPMHFGNNYNDNGIVAPSANSNHFPDLDVLCKGCKYLHTDDSIQYRCQNPKYERSWKYIKQCTKYQKAVKAKEEQLIKKQAPNIRACALLACLVCKGKNPPKLITKYFDNLFICCKKVLFEGKEFRQENNTIQFWKNIIRSRNWGDIESQIWMEKHGSLTCRQESLTKIVSDIVKLKQYLFGVGAYASGDRFG